MESRFVSCALLSDENLTTVVAESGARANFDSSSLFSLKFEINLKFNSDWNRDKNALVVFR